MQRPMVVNESAGPIPADAIPVGCAGRVEPSVLTYPPAERVYSHFFFFIVSTISFALNPHLIQRCFIARNDHGLKVVAGTLIASAFIAMLPGVYLGITNLAFSPGWPQASRDMPDAFAQVGEELMKKGPFEYLLVTLMMCSSLAAVMSSADSVMMGVSSTVAVDMVQGLLAPEVQLSDATTVHVGEAMSLVQVVIAIFVGTLITPRNFTSLLVLQNGIVAQVLPAFMLGLFTRISTRAITAGMCTGLSVIFLLSVGVSSPFGGFVPEANVGLAANVIVLVAVNLIAPGTDKREINEHHRQLEHKYGGPMLSPEIIEKCCDDMREPSPLLPILMIFVALLGSPVYGEEGTPVETMMGIPSWAFWSLVFFSVSAAVGGYTIYVWQPPAGDKEDVSKGQRCSVVSTLAASRSFESGRRSTRRESFELGRRGSE